MHSHILSENLMMFEKASRKSDICTLNFHKTNFPTRKFHDNRFINFIRTKAFVLFMNSNLLKVDFQTWVWELVRTFFQRISFMKLNFNKKKSLCRKFP
jgi:hypothetical protein